MNGLTGRRLRSDAKSHELCSHILTFHETNTLCETLVPLYVFLCTIGMQTKSHKFLRRACVDCDDDIFLSNRQTIDDGTYSFGLGRNGKMIYAISTTLLPVQIVRHT